MKIICSKTDLLHGVNVVSKAVPSKTTMPILECVLIDASTDIIKFTTNDMELCPGDIVHVKITGTYEYDLEGIEVKLQ